MKKRKMKITSLEKRYDLYVGLTIIVMIIFVLIMTLGNIISVKNFDYEKEIFGINAMNIKNISFIIVGYWLLIR